MIPKICLSWKIVDHWWTENPTTKECIEVDWDGRKIVMFREDNDQVWRVWRKISN